MATANQKMLEFERLKSWAGNGRVHDALRELMKIAKSNHLEGEFLQFQKIKESLEFLDAHLQANSIDPQLAGAKRNRMVFELLDIINNLEERKNLEVAFRSSKDVNLVLSSSIGLNEEKRNALKKTLEKILGVGSDNIGIEQLAAR